MSYSISIVDRVNREAQIKSSSDASRDQEDFYDFRAAKISLKVIRIHIGLLIYRMENFRTFSDQAEYLAREGASSDFFYAGQENESVQQIQHEILFRLACKGKAESVVPVISVLEQEGQRDTLLVTHSGVIVNGNRRLAAMRELLERDSKAYASFAHVTCKVLPQDATPNDILDIEGKLQARPEVRLDYDWIGDAKLLSKMMKAKGTSDAVADFLGRRRAEVKNALQALEEADMYLHDWVNAAGEYSRVAENGEQLFKDIASQLQGKTAATQDASRALAWTLFENRTKLDGRLYNYNISFGKRAEDVLNQLAEEFGIETSSSAEHGANDFEFDIEDDGTVVNYQPLISLLKDDPRKEEATESLIAICNSIIASEKDMKSGGAALKAISVANAKLAEVDLTRATQNTHLAIQQQLNSIVERATVLQAKLRTIIDQSETKSSGGDSV